MTGLRLLLRTAGALLLAAIAWVHAGLWLDGYRDIPTIGWLFALNVVGAAVLAVAVLVTPRRFLALVAVAGAGLAAGTAAGLLVSTQVELFGFRESLEAESARLSLWLEGAATVVLLALAALSTRRRDPRRVHSTVGPGAGSAR
jgi:hypothetical protein